MNHRLLAVVLLVGIGTPPGLLADPGGASSALLVAESRPGPSLRLSWPEAFADATLESAPFLGPGAAWRAVPGVPTRAGGFLALTLEAFEWEQYFRLRLASPALRVELASDTGPSRSDRITSIPTVVGSLPDRGSVRAFSGSLDGSAPAASLLADLRPDGGFVLDAGRLAEIAGGTLADGPHELRLTAERTEGSRTEGTLSFVLDTTPPE
ncbi:MAG: hypothetical protein JNL97_04190, partial [Verrucomicrobiales bacterium]|nr:hypothetical protein [Verrucomicrobiales bacterium]